MSKNLSIVKDSYVDDAEAAFNYYAINNYDLIFNGIKIKKSSTEDCIVEIKKLEIAKNLEDTNFEVSVFYGYRVIENEEFMAIFESKTLRNYEEVSIYFKKYSQIKEVFDVIKSFEEKDEELYVSITSIYQDAGKNIATVEDTKVAKDFSINSESYYPYLDVQEMFNQYLMSDGNILMLTGVPGCGKTTLGDLYMSFLLDKSAKKALPIRKSNDYFRSEGVQIAYVKDESLLSREDFWVNIKVNDYDLIFLDDLDYGLLPRSQSVSSEIELEKNKFISNLLSYTDGIFKENDHTKIIISTNREVNDIDSAILRKGRTFDILKLRELKNREAKDIWINEGLPIDKFEDQFKSSSVLQADLGSAIKILKKSIEDSVTLSPYIKEKEISLYSSFKDSKSKIGL